MRRRAAAVNFDRALVIFDHAVRVARSEAGVTYDWMRSLSEDTVVSRVANWKLALAWQAAGST